MDNVKYELTGILDSLKDPVTNEPYDDSYYQAALVKAVGYAEKEFDIVIRPRPNIERVDYHRADYDDFMSVNLSMRPILHIDKIQLYFNNQKILDYPDIWIKVNNRVGQLNIQPSILMQGYYGYTNQALYPLSGYPFGMSPVPYQQDEFAPQMIGVNYFAGMIPQPDDEEGVNRDFYPQPDLIAYVCKYAAIEILEKWGRNIVGAGIAGYTTSYDSMHTGIETTSSPENSAASGEIHNLQEDMKHIHDGLLSYYGYSNIGIIG